MGRPNRYEELKIPHLVEWSFNSDNALRYLFHGYQKYFKYWWNMANYTIMYMKYFFQSCLPLSISVIMLSAGARMDMGKKALNIAFWVIIVQKIDVLLPLLLRKVTIIVYWKSVTPLFCYSISMFVIVRFISYSFSLLLTDCTTRQQ